jgi:L-arabinose isomerase
LFVSVRYGDGNHGDTFRIGNTNSRLRFSLRPAQFLERWCAEGPTHHVALGIGHVAAEVRKVASLLGLEYAEVG